MKIAKIVFAIILIFAVSANMFSSYAYNTNEKSDYTATEIDYGAIKEITDPLEIKAIAKKEGFDNSEDIVKLVYCYFDEEETYVSPYNQKVSPRYLGTDYYVKQDTIQVTESRGGLLRSSKFVAPGGSMTIKESVAVTVSVDVEIDAQVLSSSLGFDVERKYEVSETQNVTVPEGKTYTVKAYVNNLVYSFEIWEDDIFFDNIADRASVTKPIGVVFTITKS